MISAVRMLTVASLLAASCASGPSTVQSIQQPQILVDADGIPVVFHREGGPWYVKAEGSLPAGAELDGVWAFLPADAWRVLTIDGWRIERQGKAIVLRLASADFRMTPPPGRAVLVDGSQVTVSQEWYETHHELLSWLERKRREAAAGKPATPAKPRVGDGPRGHIWSVE